MSSQRRVYHVAKEAGREATQALELLREAGFPLSSINDLLPLSGRAKALAVLKGNLKSTRPLPAPQVDAPAARTAPPRPAALASPAPAPKLKHSRVARLTEDDVLVIRRRMATSLIAERDAFGGTEPLWYDKFSMAVQRQFTSGGGIYKYDTIHEVAATLAFGIAMNHAFENGNKRTALVSLLVCLNQNRTLLVDVSEDDLYSLITELVKHEIPIRDGKQRNADTEVQAVAHWVRSHSRTLELGDRLMRFSELRGILSELDCTFDRPDNNFIKIRREGYSVKIGYPRRDFELDAQEVKRIRRGLQLDEIHGVDSAGFYNLEGAVDEFVNKYRNLMRRLADL